MFKRTHTTPQTCKCTSTRPLANTQPSHLQSKPYTTLNYKLCKRHAAGSLLRDVCRAHASHRKVLRPQASSRAKAVNVAHVQDRLAYVKRGTLALMRFIMTAAFFVPAR